MIKVFEFEAPSSVNLTVCLKVYFLARMLCFSRTGYYLCVTEGYARCVWRAFFPQELTMGENGLFITCH